MKEKEIYIQFEKMHEVEVDVYNQKMVEDITGSIIYKPGITAGEIVKYILGQFECVVELNLKDEVKNKDFNSMEFELVKITYLMNLAD